MYKYEMDQTKTVGATERTPDAGRTDRGTDGRTEWNQYAPQQIRCARVWFIISIHIFLSLHTVMYMSNIENQGPHGLNIIPAWINIHMSGKILDEWLIYSETSTAARALNIGYAFTPYIVRYIRTTSFYRVLQNVFDEYICEAMTVVYSSTTVPPWVKHIPWQTCKMHNRYRMYLVNEDFGRDYLYLWVCFSYRLNKRKIYVAYVIRVTAIAPYKMLYSKCASSSVVSL